MQSPPPGRVWVLVRPVLQSEGHEVSALELLEGSEPDCRLGAVADALVLADLLVKLQLGLDVSGRIGDADLDTASDAASDDAFQELQRENAVT